MIICITLWHYDSMTLSQASGCIPWPISRSEKTERPRWNFRKIFNLWKPIIYIFVHRYIGWKVRWKAIIFHSFWENIYMKEGQFHKKALRFTINVHWFTYHVWQISSRVGASRYHIVEHISEHSWQKNVCNLREFITEWIIRIINRANEYG